MSSSAVSTHVVESTVINAPQEAVWSSLGNLTFSWWNLVESCAPSGEGTCNTVGSLFDVRYKDGTQWTIQLVELSNINKSLTFEVIACEPSAPFTSAIHTLSVKKVTMTNATFVEWVTDFSNDATSAVVMDSSFKRRDAFGDLAASFA